MHLKKTSIMKFLDENSLKSSRLYDDVKQLFDNIGLFEFLLPKPLAFRCLTLEFF